METTGILENEEMVEQPFSDRGTIAHFRGFVTEWDSVVIEGISDRTITVLIVSSEFSLK
jgi:hypothetical protein